MFQKLQARWKVNGIRLTLILLTFAIGGSITGYAARKLINLFHLHGLAWIVVYVLLVTLLWPIAVLALSVPFGQYSFFSRYLRRVGARLGLKSGVSAAKTPVRIAIFASGTGSNARKIIDRFSNNARIKVSLIVSNRPDAGVLAIAATENIPTLILDRKRFMTDGYQHELNEYGIDVIVLAGFLWKLPAILVRSYPGRIINIHPALLPKFGGKGMYGHHVHEAVLAANEKKSGITIHYVDELYDHGQVILQVPCEVLDTDNADSLALRIHELEHLHYPRVVEEVVSKLGHA